MRGVGMYVVFASGGADALHGCSDSVLTAVLSQSASRAVRTVDAAAAPAPITANIMLHKSLFEKKKHSCKTSSLKCALVYNVMTGGHLRNVYVQL